MAGGGVGAVAPDGEAGGWNDGDERRDGLLER